MNQRGMASHQLYMNNGSLEAVLLVVITWNVTFWVTSGGGGRLQILR